MNNNLLSTTWIILPYVFIIGILIIMSVRMYIGNKRTYRLNRNLHKYINTVHYLQKDLEQLNRSLQDVSSNEETDPVINDKIRLAIWQINTIQDTLISLINIEKDTTWISNKRTFEDKETSYISSEHLTEKNNVPTLVTVIPSVTDQQFLEKVFIIIRENFNNPDFTVDILSYKMGMSRSSFFNKIKGISGQAPADFIRQYRMERAKELLRTKQYTIAEVAFKSGFSDVKYFRDVFRKKFNQSPSQFAKTR
jgi:AraC-like DNA-binding protein